MPRLTDDELESIRAVDLLTYLAAVEPHELKRTGTGEYRTVTHGSLVIRPDYWYWNKGSVGGSSALDFLIKIKGIPFAEAARLILDAGLTPNSYSLPAFTPSRRERRDQRPPAAFALPSASCLGTHMIPYLQNRGIHSDIIALCMKSGILYEGKYKDRPVCVFVGKDEGGIPRFAHMRGITTDLKQDASGSQKRFSFCLPANDMGSKTLAVFEAPIDALSHATMQMRKQWNCDCYRLSLGGTSDVALIPFLERHPGIRRIALHLDRDSAGYTAMHRIRDRLKADSRFKHIRISISPPRKGKDYNEALQISIRESKEQNQADRRTAVFL
ncbi:topoisomerase [Actinomycetota bacterium]|nr:topoisomerase [Actinomycetota bacterium]